MPDKKRILIVEDEKDMISVLKQRLTSTGCFDITVAFDGQEGLAKAQRENPDLIILDLMLPKLDGYKVCRILKFSDKSKNIPIVIYTARTQKEDRKLAADCGADAYIPKTLGQEALVDRINILLSSSH
jgi:two-component system, OmpR family, response regulator VicR